MVLSRLETLHNLYSSPNFVRVIKSRMIRKVGHTPYTREMRNKYKISGENIKEIYYLGEASIDVMTELKWILNKFGTRVWTGLISLRTGSMVGLCEHGNEHMCSRND